MPQSSFPVWRWKCLKENYISYFRNGHKMDIVMFSMMQADEPCDMCLWLRGSRSIKIRKVSTNVPIRAASSPKTNVLLRPQICIKRTVNLNLKCIWNPNSYKKWTQSLKTGNAELIQFICTCPRGLFLISGTCIFVPHLFCLTFWEPVLWRKKK